jgi:archaeal flagellar protein FlaI
MMYDPNIEDLSIDALAKPPSIYHKGYESLETNLAISDEERMDNPITTLSHMAGKHVSTAFPIVQGTLRGRHRLVATFRREVCGDPISPRMDSQPLHPEATGQDFGLPEV